MGLTIVVNRITCSPFGLSSQNVRFEIRLVPIPWRFAIRHFDLLFSPILQHMDKRRHPFGDFCRRLFLSNHALYLVMKPVSGMTSADTKPEFFSHSFLAASGLESLTRDRLNFYRCDLSCLLDRLVIRETRSWTSPFFPFTGCRSRLRSRSAVCGWTTTICQKL